MPAAPAGGPSDNERARLRAAGLTDAEITRIFAARGLGSPPPGSGTAAGVPQAPVSGVMGNFSAIWAHARNIIPTMAAQIMTVFSTSASASARAASLLAVMVKAAFVLVFAYVVALEFSQLRAATDRARVEACQARQQSLNMNRPTFSEDSIAVKKAAEERARKISGRPPKQETPEEQEKERSLQQKRQEKEKRYEEMDAQWQKDCADVAP